MPHLSFRARVFALAAVIALLILPSAAFAGNVTGTVTNADGTPQDNARVVVIDTNGTPGTGDDRTVGAGDTATNGTFTIPVPTGGGTPTADNEVVKVVTHDGGSAPTQTNVTLSSGAGSTGTILAQASGTTFAALGIYGGQINRVVAGGAPCEFYAKTSVIPQIFGTSDCGGTWTAVTTQTDSSASGLNGSSAIDSPNFTTSGVPGEVAALVNGTVQFSRDYGVTWSTVGGTALTGPSQSRYVYWGHVVGGRDVLVVRDGATLYTADLSAGTPALAARTGYISASTDGVAVGNGASQPFIAVATAFNGSAQTTVAIFPLQDGNAPAANATLTNETVTGAASGNTPILGLGGASTTGPPNVLAIGDLVAGNDVIRVISDTADGATFASGAASTVTGNDCGSSLAGSINEATVAPVTDPRASGGTAGLVGFGKCSVELNATGATATAQVGAVQGFAIDPGWGTTRYDVAAGSGSPATSRVLIAPQGDRGIQKSAVGSGAPPTWPAVSTTGAAGVASSSAGIVVNGLSVPVVRDIRFGPGGATDTGVIFSVSGGGLCIASSDGLATAANTKVVADHGGRAMDWWQGAGASDDWILCDHGDGTMAGRKDWTPASATVTSTIDVVGGSNNFTSGQHGIDAFYAISGVPGADAAFLGGHVAGAGAGTGKVLRVGLSVTGGGAVQFAAGYPAFTLSEPISRLAYCPAGSAAGFADVLFIGTGVRNAGGGGGGATGKVYRLASASTAVNGAAPTLMTGSGTTGVGGLDVNCTSGALFVGYQSGGSASDPAIQRSTDGTTLTTVKTHGALGGGITNVSALAVNPSSAGELIFATASEGKVWASLDAGTTLTVANNPQVFPGGVNFNSEGIWALRIPPGLTRAAGASVAARRAITAPQSAFKSLISAQAAISSSSTVVGTGGGAYRASFRSGLTLPASGGSGGGGGSAAPSAGTSGTTTRVTTPSTRIAGARWSAANRTVTANVTVAKPGKVALTVSLKKGTKLTVVTTGSATVKKAGTSPAVFTLKKKLAKGTYVLSIAGGGKTTLVVR